MGRAVFRNVLAVIVGFVIGSVVNMGLVQLGWRMIPVPAGVNVHDVKSMAASMHLFEAKHFIFPFLGHALGAFSGALTAYLIASTRRTMLSLVVGSLFLLGGIAACLLLPAPPWFIVLDLTLAYMPMAWLATVAGRRFFNPAAAN